MSDSIQNITPKPTFSTFLCAEMTRAVEGMETNGAGEVFGPFRRTDLRYSIDGCVAVVRDMRCGQDYEITVKPMEKDQ